MIMSTACHRRATSVPPPTRLRRPTTPGGSTRRSYPSVRWSAAASSPTPASSTVGDLRARDIAAAVLARRCSHFDWAQLRDTKRARCMQNRGMPTYVRPPRRSLSDVVPRHRARQMVIDSLVDTSATRRLTTATAFAPRAAASTSGCSPCHVRSVLPARPRGLGARAVRPQFARRLVKFPDLSALLIRHGDGVSGRHRPCLSRLFIGRRVDEVILSRRRRENSHLVQCARKVPKSEILVYVTCSKRAWHGVIAQRHDLGRQN